MQPRAYEGPPQIYAFLPSAFLHFDRVSIYSRYVIFTLLLLLLLQRTIVPRRLTQWAAALVRHPTDPTHIALVIRVVAASVPVPFGDCASVLHVHFHRLIASVAKQDICAHDIDLVGNRSCDVPS